MTELKTINDIEQIEVEGIKLLHKEDIRIQVIKWVKECPNYPYGFCPCCQDWLRRFDLTEEDLKNYDLAIQLKEAKQNEVKGE